MIFFFSLSATSLPYLGGFLSGLASAQLQGAHCPWQKVFSVCEGALQAGRERLWTPVRSLKFQSGKYTPHRQESNPCLSYHRLPPVILGQITILWIAFRASSFEPKLSFSRRFPSQSWKLTLVCPPVHCKLLFRCCLCGLPRPQL